MARRVLEGAGTKQPDLILIGFRGFGSVVHDIIRQTRTPVLLVPVGT